MATPLEKPDIKIFLFRVAMTCQGCTSAVQRVLIKHKEMGIQNVEIDLEGQMVKVTTCGNVSPYDVLELIRKTGKSVEYINLQ